MHTCAHVCVCMCMQVLMSVCLHVCGSHRSGDYSPFYLLRQCLWLNPELTHWMSLPCLPRDPISTSQVLRLQVGYHAHPFLCALKLRPLAFYALSYLPRPIGNFLSTSIPQETSHDKLWLKGQHPKEQHQITFRLCTKYIFIINTFISRLWSHYQPIWLCRDSRSQGRGTFKVTAPQPVHASSHTSPSHTPTVPPLSVPTHFLPCSFL